jgi:fumarate reductase flavoprotein subunit
MFINKRGERFRDETWSGNTSANALLAQPGKIGFALSDAKSAQGPDGSHDVQEQSPDLKDSKTGESLSESETKAANNWDEIAQWIGADSKVLKATVEQYNSFCKQGNDDIFGKDSQGSDYNLFGGAALGFAINSRRIAGENAARDISGK